jgi:hypothetical protein
MGRGNKGLDELKEIFGMWISMMICLFFAMIIYSFVLLIVKFIWY